MEVTAIQVGALIGSALIPVARPRYPRTTLLLAAAGMLLFMAVFAAALKLGLTAVGFIPLAFLMQLYSG